jgi:putative ATP-dependent endonuclease of OLD family
MLRQFPDAYDIKAEELEVPTDAVVAAVLGKMGDAASYDDDQKALFPAYHRRFKLGSKPARHIAALAELDDAALKVSMPEPIRRLTEQVVTTLSGLPE